MKRMIDCNDFISCQLVFEWHEDICCLIKEFNHQQLDNHSLERFRSKMNLEKKLEERQLQFHQTIGDRKSLSELIHQYEIFSLLSSAMFVLSFKNSNRINRTKSI